MTVTVVGMWEKDWLDPKTELFMFRQLKGAFGFDRLVMVPVLLSDRTSVDQYDTMEEALSSTSGKKIFLEPSGDTTLSSFNEYEDVVYIMAKASINNQRLITEDDLSVRIDTPNDTDMFAVNAISIALYERTK